MKTTINNQMQNIDYIVSQNLKKYRLQLGFSQGEIAVAVGVSIQQVRKYENAINRISSGKLFCMASLLKVPIDSFFIN